jgi:hypothetical protein
MNRTYISEKDDIKKRIAMMREKLQKMYGYRYPIQRRVVEDRIQGLEKQFLRFEYIINPYHIQPGLLLDVDITSIKRKKATLDGMSNVLNEFLFGVSKGFQDAAFARTSRSRSPSPRKYRRSARNTRRCSTFRPRPRQKRPPRESSTPAGARAGPSLPPSGAGAAAALTTPSGRSERRVLRMVTSARGSPFSFQERGSTHAGATPSVRRAQHP